MANIKSAEKRNRQSLIRRERNRSNRSRLRTAVKNLRGAVAQGETAKAQELLTPTLALLDRSAQKGVLHPNAAARTKSRLSRAVDSIAG